MFSNAINIVPNFSNIHYFRQSYFCSVCKQRFQTERNFIRHNNSRKHIRQIEIIRENACRIIRSKDVATKMGMLPNKVIEELINDLTDQTDEKEDFFKEIQLVDDCELDAIDPNPFQNNATVPRYRIQNNFMDFQRPKLFNRNESSTYIPATYPCLTCFQLLDSQQNFDEHMLRSHFNIPRLSIDTNLNIKYE